jgi:hypothetical protein
MKLSFYLSTLLILLGSYSCWATDHVLTQAQFLSRIMDNSLMLDRALIYNLPPNFLKDMFDKQKAQYPWFKEEMEYAEYYKDNKWMYTINYDWSNKTCLLRIEELSPETGRPTVDTVDGKGTVIDKKYCDKVYGTTL